MGFHTRKASQSGSGAPSAVTPEFIGQVYVDTVGPTYYSAFGLSSGNWTNLSTIVGNHASNHTDGTDDIQDATDSVKGLATAAQITKLDAIEALADVTDGTNVAAAGAVMEADTTIASMSFVLDEDNMASDSATKLATQQSIKKYVDDAVASEVSYKGGYNASTNSPDLDTSPSGVEVGDMYTVTAAGNFFTAAVEVGDVLIAEVADADAEAEWTIVNKDLNAASIKTSYESNADTNAFEDADETKLDGIEELADVTDGTNVAAAGAVMEADTTIASMSFVLDEDNMASDSATKLATQQSIKKYVDDADALLQTEGEDYAIKVYDQNDEPSLGADDKVAIWKDADDSDRIYLMFRRATGDHVGVELT